jgi:hypothetical protein
MSAPRRIIEVGERFGRLRFVKDVENIKGKRAALWKCKCGTTIVTRVAFVTGTTVTGTKSCGCLKRETNQRLKRNFVHGGSGTKEYSTYLGMKKRCYKKTDSKYPRYGGRGIRICSRWLGKNGFPNFLSDMGPRPSGHTIERKDNDGNYEPGNCIWATALIQNRNSSMTRPLLLDGVRILQIDLARMLGIKSTTVANRLKRGQTPEEIRLDFIC